MRELKDILLEGVFDKDLVTRDTGFEYIYSLVEKASVLTNYFIDYIDTKKIRHDFNELSKKFKMQQWSDNKWFAMDRIQSGEPDEMLRELLYIVATKIESQDTHHINKLYRSIEEVIGEYANLNKYNTLDIDITNKDKLLHIYIRFMQDVGDTTLRRLGRIEIVLRQL